jgi:hypothetical protein
MQQQQQQQQQLPPQVLIEQFLRQHQLAPPSPFDRPHRQTSGYDEQFLSTQQPQEAFRRDSPAQPFNHLQFEQLFQGRHSRSVSSLEELIRRQQEEQQQQQQQVHLSPSQFLDSSCSLARTGSRSVAWIELAKPF